MNARHSYVFFHSNENREMFSINCDHSNKNNISQISSCGRNMQHELWVTSEDAFEELSVPSEHWWWKGIGRWEVTPALAHTQHGVTLRKKPNGLFHVFVVNMTLALFHNTYVQPWAFHQRPFVFGITFDPGMLKILKTRHLKAKISYFLL